MPKEIVVPRLGWSMEEGVFAEWLHSPGAYIRAGENLFVLEGDKAAQEVESIESGWLCIPDDAPKSGTTVRVGQIIGYLLADGERAPSTLPPYRPVQTPIAPLNQTAIENSDLRPRSLAHESSAAPAHRVGGPAARRRARELGIELDAVWTPDPTGRVTTEDVERTAQLRQRRSIAGQPPTSTPRARRIARELGIDWQGLSGTGRGGRIRASDVLAQQHSHNDHRASTAEEIPPFVPGKHVPATSLRKAIARRIQTAARTTVPVTLVSKVDASSLVAARDRWKLSAHADFIPSYNEIFVFLVARTLRELPYLNACWYRDGIYTYDAINISVAIDTDLGLFAPAIPNADQLTLVQIAEQCRQLIAQTRSGRIVHQPLAHGTFTISNLGALGIDAFTPVLNDSQAGILGIGRITEEAIVRSNRIVSGHTVTLSLTFDHRILDGAPAARWLQRLSEHVGNFDQESIANGS